MDVGMLHTHHLVVVLYFLLLLSGTFVLGLGAPEQLEGFNRWARYGHMILGTLLLLTGGYLAFKSPVGLAAPALVKYAVLAVTIGLGVVGLRRRRLLLAIASLVGLVYAYGVSKTDSISLTPAELQGRAAVAALPADAPELERGRALYTTSCVACHGADGRAGFLKSKDLTAAPLDSACIVAMVRNGQKLMPAYTDYTDAELAALTAYVRSLHQP